MKKLTLLLAILSSNLFSQEWNPVSPAAAPTAPIYRAGKVGIGTFYYPGATGQWYGTGFSPAFEVNSNDALGATVNNNALMVSFSGQGTNRIRHNTWLRRNSNGGTTWWNVNVHDGISVDNVFTTPGTDTKTWWERDAFQDIQYWGNSASTYMTLFQGRLGIGRTSPAARLDIVESDPNFFAFIARSAHTVDYKTCIYANVGRDLTQAILVGNENYGGTANNWKGTFLVYGNGRTFIGASRVLSNHIHANAFVQIDGKVACKELVVLDPTKWADFVFDKNYKLKPLNEVESYYLENKHLPEVPSETDIKRDGINSAEMDATLMQKIEELTLYLVELNKKVEKLEKENEILKTNK